MSPRAGRSDYAGLSDVGRVRTHNEDAVLLSPPLYAVADGLGGHLAGEVASTLAIETLLQHAPLRADAKALGRAARTANKAVLEAARDADARSGMGTTLTAALVEGTRIAVAHVGDSRAYVLHNERLERITEDHSMVADMIRAGTLTEEESRTHPNRSVITRALGSDPNMYADTFEVDASPGDRLILCSDGLTSMLTDPQIAEIVNSYRDPEVAVRSLIDAANAAGGTDNISVIVVEIRSEHYEPTAGRRRGALWVSGVVWVFAAIALVLVAGFGAMRYAQSRAYVISESGSVVLYRGVSGDFAGVSLRWLEEETTITARALGPVTSARLLQGVPVDGVAAGMALLDEYRAQVATEPPSF
ncbi:MAG: Stp1/IreP family PP2C-type Ser/Thr phosphatase [Actinomycetota bacterium]|nr:Stp1/IreP family PP2C-type Ser/Thr phosphatase [Actinomycetota bacterium]